MKTLEKNISLEHDELIDLITKVSREDLGELKELVSKWVLEKSLNALKNKTSHDYSNFLKHLNENNKHSYCIKEYSELMNISSRQLNKIVIERSKKTACSLISSKIIEEAKKLLIESNLSVKEIAFHLGFSDQYYFSRFFKKYVLCAPKIFRYQQLTQ